MSDSRLHARSLSSSLSRSSSKQISQLYKQASQLFLTRRLQESLSVLEPAITPSTLNNAEQQPNGDSATPTLPIAPIATASSNLRIKVWNLYITILSAIVDLGAEEGKQQFGQKEWKSIASKIREGEIWGSIVQIGYGGREGSVDADVVYNLGTLLLNHSPSQKSNQERLENYLSSYGQPDLDISAHLQQLSPGGRKKRISSANGTDTPKDLSIRVKLLELFTLHVLPRNDEWDYAREFVNLSEVLDDEKKEAFLQTLDGLREEQERGAQRAAELQQEKEEELERLQKQQEEEERRRVEQEQQEQQQQQQRAKQSSSTNKTHDKPQDSHQRAGSEVDYGIEKAKPNPAIKTRSTKPALKKPSSDPSKQIKKSEKSQPALFRQARVLSNLIISMVKNLRQSLSSNPLSFLRAFLVVIGVVMALGRPDVRDRVRRITGAGWQKVRGTIGMGVKVSYI